MWIRNLKLQTAIPFARKTFASIGSILDNSRKRETMQSLNVHFLF